MTDEELQKLLESGNPADIDTALAYLEQNKQDVVNAAPSGGKPGEQEKAGTEAKDVEQGSSPADDAAAKGISSKNGEHVLPFSVLEAERQKSARLQQELEERDRELQEARTSREQAEATQRKIDLLQQQLTKHGIKPAQLAEELQLTEDELANLEDEFGEVGTVSAKTARKLLHMEQVIHKLESQVAQTTAKPAPQPVDDDAQATLDAIQATDGLPEVMKDPVLSKKAIAIDDELKAKPEFKDKPLTERFAEVMKRLAPAILAQSKGKDKDDANLDDIEPPNSLNGIPGATADVNATLAAQFANLSEEEIQHRMLQLSEAQQQQLMKELNLI